MIHLMCIISYDIRKAKEDYKKVCDEIARLQTGLDTVNATCTMKIVLDD